MSTAFALIFCIATQGRGITGASCDTCILEMIDNSGCAMLSTPDIPNNEYFYKYTSHACSARKDCLPDMVEACEKKCRDVDVPECNFENCCSDNPLALCYSLDCLGDYGYCCDVWSPTPQR